ncbi:transmembrane and coiled-coil domain-containing protein 5B isoform X3 [Peromyscus californicus insignis]|uniref:transmembrane and coiled-coil domain-containing protein 5B isoform X3 n=1 Tax=Peromyscus californicus insignis TaxID=564181 RepID=UPI0022A787BA|nr:transmembrane and coiled-coil domain-containing protein 5B isoform X3 [Peromyscus californicus insignis]
MSAFTSRKPKMEDIGQNPLDDGQEITEIPTLEAIKQNLNYLNLDLEKDLQRLDEANQILLRKIQKKEESIQSLERDIALSIGKVSEKDDLSEMTIQRENALKDLELETAKLEKKNKTLSRNVMELQKKISRGLKNAGPDSETLKKKIAELKMESDYQSVYQLCEDQAHYIKKYQEILREMEKEQEMMLLEKEISKAQNDSSQVLEPGATLVETIQSNMALPVPFLHDHGLHPAIGLSVVPPAVHKPGLSRGHSARADEQKHVEVAEGHIVSLPYSRGGRCATTLVSGDLPGLTLYPQWRGHGCGPGLVMWARKELEAYDSEPLCDS